MTLTYKSGNHTGAMVAFFVPRQIAQAIALPGGESPDDLHVTLAYLGKAADIEDPNRLRRVVADFAEMRGPIEGKIGGLGRFTDAGDNDDVFYASFDCATLPTFRESLVRHLEGPGGVTVAKDHGFTPHITLLYLPPDESIPMQTITPRPITFGAISLVMAGQREDYPLGGEIMETKAGARHSKTDRALTQDIHDAAIELGATCKMRGDVAKAGARNSGRDQGRIQKIHNAAVDLGAACKGLAPAYTRKTPVIDGRLIDTMKSLAAIKDLPNA